MVERLERDSKVSGSERWRLRVVTGDSEVPSGYAKETVTEAGATREVLGLNANSAISEHF